GHLNPFRIVLAAIAVGAALTLPGTGRADSIVITPLDICAIAPADETLTLANGQKGEVVSGDASYSQHICPRFVVDVNVSPTAYLWIYGLGSFLGGACSQGSQSSIFYMRWSYQTRFTRLSTYSRDDLCSPNDVVLDPGLPWYGRTYRLAYEAKAWYG